VTTLSSDLGDLPIGIAFDGQRIWTANRDGSVSIITLNPIVVTNVSTGFTQPRGLVYDRANIWLTDVGDDTLKKLDSNGGVLLSVAMGSNANPSTPAFDGTNIWVPNSTSNTVKVIRASGGLAGTVIATLTGNGLSGPATAAFDGERVLVTNESGDSVSLWKASDLTLIGTFSTGADTNPFGACSDGLNFWITLNLAGAVDKLARF
jgi:DNA-binding beta-propeller fold protein YncE